MGSDVIQSILDSANRQGVASINQGQIDPRGPIGQAILAQSQQRDQRMLGGAPPQSLWTSGKGPDSFSNADSRAFQRAGDEFGQGSYAAAAGNAVGGTLAAVPAAVADVGQSALQTVGKPLVAAHSAIGSVAQTVAPHVSEFVRGLTGGPPSPPTNADVVMAAIKSAPQGATPMQGQPQGQPQGQLGVLSEELLKSLPKMQSEAIRSMGGISHRDLLTLLQANAQQADPVWQGKAAFNSGMAGKSMMEAGGVHLDDKTGAVTYGANFPTDPVLRAEAADQIRRHQARIEMGKPYIYPVTTIMPGIGQGG